MFAPSLVYKEVKDIGSSWSIEEKIIFFWNKVEVSSLEDEEKFILEACSPIEKVNMAISHDLPLLTYCPPSLRT